METDPSVKKTIALFGGTFDPPHKGHTALVSSFIKSGLPDEVWVLPTPVPPFKTKEFLTPFEHRLKMTHIAFKGRDKVQVMDYESRFIGTSYTVNTIEHLKKDFPNYSWMLCIGEDNLSLFEKWYRYTDILKMASLLVAARPGFKSDTLTEIVQTKSHFVEHVPLDISSTQIRNELKIGVRSKNISSDVFAYIKKENLYKS